MPADLRFTPDELSALIESGDFTDQDILLLHPSDRAVALKLKGESETNPLELMGSSPFIPGLPSMGGLASKFSGMADKAVKSLPYVGAAAGGAVKHPFLGYRAGQMARDFLSRGAPPSAVDPRNLSRHDALSSALERASGGVKVEMATPNLTKMTATEAVSKGMGPSGGARGFDLKARPSPSNIQRSFSAADEEKALRAAGATEEEIRKLYHQIGGAQQKGVRVEGARMRRPKK